MVNSDREQVAPVLAAVYAVQQLLGAKGVAGWSARQMCEACLTEQGQAAGGLSWRSIFARTRPKARRRIFQTCGWASGCQCIARPLRAATSCTSGRETTAASTAWSGWRLIYVKEEEVKTWPTQGGDFRDFKEPPSNPILWRNECFRYTKNGSYAG